MSNSLTELVPWVIAHGYLIFLLVAILEGPIVTIAAGVAVGLGYFNVWAVISLAMLGDFGADLVYFGLGYLGYDFVRQSIFRRLGLTAKRIALVEDIFHRNITKALAIIKLSPAIGIPGLIILGTMRPPLKKFVKVAFLISLPKTLFFVACGYFSAASYEKLDKIISQAPAIAAIIILLALSYLAFMKIVSWLVKRLEK